MPRRWFLERLNHNAYLGSHSEGWFFLFADYATITSFFFLVSITFFLPFRFRLQGFSSSFCLTSFFENGLITYIIGLRGVQVLLCEGKSR